MCFSIGYYLTSTIVSIVVNISRAFGIDGNVVNRIAKTMAKGTLAMTLFGFSIISIFVIALTITTLVLFGLYLKFTPSVDISRSLNVSYSGNKYTSQLLFMPEEKVLIFNDRLFNIFAILSNISSSRKTRPKKLILSH